MGNLILSFSSSTAIIIYKSSSAQVLYTSPITDKCLLFVDSTFTVLLIIIGL